MSKQIATIDNATANQEEVNEQMEEYTVEKVAHKNAASAPAIKGTEDLGTADNAAASSEEVAEQAQESRIDKVAFEDGISTVAAEEYIERGRNHD